MALKFPSSQAFEFLKERIDTLVQLCDQWYSVEAFGFNVTV